MSRGFEKVRLGKRRSVTKGGGGSGEPWIFEEVHGVLSAAKAFRQASAARQKAAAHEAPAFADEVFMGGAGGVCLGLQKRGVNAFNRR